MINIINFVKQRVKATDNVLDIGCGNRKITRELRYSTLTTIDAYKEFEPTYCIDLEWEGLPKQNYDIILMLDIIEHLTKERGKIILEEAKQNCCREIILFTPLFWKSNVCTNTRSPYFNNPWNLHRSLWSLTDFQGWERYSVENNLSFCGVWNVLL